MRSQAMINLIAYAVFEYKLSDGQSIKEIDGKLSASLSGVASALGGDGSGKVEA